MKTILKIENYKSDRNELWRSISGFSFENSSEKEIKDLLDFSLGFILRYTPEDDFSSPTKEEVKEIGRQVGMKMYKYVIWSFFIGLVIGLLF